MSGHTLSGAAAGVLSGLLSARVDKCTPKDELDRYSRWYNDKRIKMS